MGIGPSKTQVDKLGERLKSGPASEDDLRALDEYRQSFAAGYAQVVSDLRQLGLEPTGRPAKSTTSIVEKLERESIRLTQIQDIAGCRVVVPSVAAQDVTVSALAAGSPKSRVIDRRDMPSHGYRAVHVVIESNGVPVEVQVRTELQHAWAEWSEKISDVVDSRLKYGMGEEKMLVMLQSGSLLVSRIEADEVEAAVSVSNTQFATQVADSRRTAIEMFVRMTEQWVARRSQP